MKKKKNMQIVLQDRRYNILLLKKELQNLSQSTS